mmetsp:Transcript_31189/g.99471  ORF Transcript_31189/g.99471 Transcript_31189/m.99471 type:complete len:241 (+) Transcript_31189:194-916(+)
MMTAGARGLQGLTRHTPGATESSCRGGRTAPTAAGLRGAAPLARSPPKMCAGLGGGAVGRPGFAVPTMPSRPTQARRGTVGTQALLSPSAWFTVATVGVMPFYTLMIGAPRWKWTKAIVTSPVPYALMAILYGYLLVVSWSPDTLQLMFANEYYFPELKDMALLFSRVNTVASAWIHLLAMDLFAARQVYLEGLEGNLVTRHSLVLCCLFAPIGLLCHFITKAIVQTRRKRQQGDKVYSF